MKIKRSPHASRPVQTKKKDSPARVTIIPMRGADTHRTKKGGKAGTIDGNYQKMEAALRQSESRYHALFDKMTEGFALHEIVCDKKGVPVDYRFLEINPAFEQLTGLKRDEIIGKLKSAVLPGDDPKWVTLYGQVALGGKPVRFDDYSLALKRHYDVLAYSPAPGQFAVLFSDVSEQRKREEDLRKLNRTLKALSNSTQAMMRATNEAEYLKEICMIIVKNCGHVMAWIGYAEKDDAKTVQPVAHAGFEKGYLKTLRITWSDAERGRGPTGTAIRTGKSVICKNMLNDPSFAPWREEASRRGYASLIALPLLARGQAFGAITIYSRETDPFSDAEVELLGELARRLAYGIRALRLRLEHGQAEEALKVSLTKYKVLFESFPLGISISDQNGKLIESNKEAERLLELPKKEHEKRTIHGKDWRVIRPDGTPMPEAEFASVRALKEKRLIGNMEMGILKGKGNVTWINVTAAPIPLADYGVAITYGDISERKQMEEALRRSESILHSFFDSPGVRREIVDVIDETEIRHIASNQEMAKYYGLTPEAMQNKTSAELGESPETVRLWIDRYKKSRRSHQPVSFEFSFTRGDQEIWQSVVITYLGRISRGQHRFSQVIIDISERKRMEKALQESTNYLENLLNYANAPIIVWNPFFRIIRFNRAFERLTGHAADQVHGKPLDMLFPAASKNESLKLIRDTLKGRHWEIVEIPILQKSGAIRTVLWNSANIHDKDGAVIATIAQGQDITERKQTEEQVAASLHEKEMLLRELYHRTKNNMNVISSLVMLQGAAVKDPAVLRMFSDMQSRIRAMSLVHEKLYQSSDLFNLDIREYITDLAGTILAGYKNSVARISLNLDIESVPFSIDTALPCGLVINELMSNSLKYAFSEDMTGEIGISLRVSPENEVTLHYYDNGIGFPDGFDPVNASSLGLKLVNNLVKRQLLGKLEFKAAPGVWAEIRFKKTLIERPERA
jgi:PAS domain S-box-containing protein